MNPVVPGLRRGMRGIVAATCLAVGLIAAAPPAAEAKPQTPNQKMTAKLKVGGNNTSHPGRRLVTVEGVVSMSRSVAQSRVDRGATVAVVLFGDDEGRRDKPIFRTFGPATYWAAEDGFHYRVSARVRSAQLNEDLGPPLFGEQDELYATADWVPGRTPPASGSAKSNPVVGDF